jgi:hypothetical protein
MRGSWLVLLLLLGCDKDRDALRDPEGPTLGAKCDAAQPTDKPFIVDWPAADRAELEATAQRGVAVVRYEGCDIQVLTRCRAPAQYEYVGVTPKRDTVVIRNANELWANIPVGAAKFEAKLAVAGQLNVDTVMVGRYQALQPVVAMSELAGECDGATHVVSGVTVGAFEFFSGKSSEVGGGATVGPAGAGGKTSSVRETLSRDGDPSSCEAGAPDGPPNGCGALLRLEVTALGEAPATGTDGARKQVAHPLVELDSAQCRRGQEHAVACDRELCAIRGEFGAAAELYVPDRWTMPRYEVDAACERLADPHLSACKWDGPDQLDACTAACDAGKRTKLRKVAGKLITYPDATPCYYKGIAYNIGKGVPADPDKARQIWTEACAQGDPISCQTVARILDKEGKTEEFQRTLARACELGDEASCEWYQASVKAPMH